MQPVEIMPIQDSLVLRARGSELLILAQHVTELKQRKSPRDFSMYFTVEALVNRPARKLFEAWLRKDDTLWQRLFKMIHEMEQGVGAEDEAKAEVPEVKAKQVALKAKGQVIDPVVSTKAKSAKTEVKDEVKAEVKKEAKKEAAKKEAPKKVAAPSQSAPKKPEKAAAKPAAKAVAKPAAKAAPAKKTVAAKPAKSAKPAPTKAPAKSAAKTGAKAGKAKPAKKR